MTRSKKTGSMPLGDLGDDALSWMDEPAGSEPAGPEPAGSSGLRDDNPAGQPAPQPAPRPESERAAAPDETPTPRASTEPPSAEDSRRRGVSSGYIRHTLILREDHVEMLNRLVALKKAVAEADEAPTKKDLAEQAFDLLFEEEAAFLRRFSRLTSP